jgi:hypothetical protein
MPKDEFDFDDPMELNGMALLSGEDTTDAMTECFIEEFMRMGYNHKQVLALFRNPHYVGMNMALQNRGEDCVKDFIVKVFARWGRAVAFASRSGDSADRRHPTADKSATLSRDAATLEESIVLDTIACDPMGAAIPKLNL